MKTANLSAAVLVLLALVLVGASAGRAETLDCTPITVLPAIITVDDIYCLIDDLTTAVTQGYAIDIRTNNVVLDLNGHKLGGLSAGLATQTTGIHANNRRNITIKNGTIRGFRIGISLEDAGNSEGHVVEDIRADRNTLTGIEARGAGNLIRNNQVVATGGSAFGPNVSSFGMFIAGSGPRVLNNDVIETFKQGTGLAIGIQLQQTTGALAVNNRVTTADQGIIFAGFGTGKYRDNLTFDVATPYVGGTDAGNNN